MSGLALKHVLHLLQLLMLNYSQQMKITKTAAEFSVLIQEQLEADVSGIAFSMNPISNHDQELFIEYVKGSGEDLANGRLTPKSLTLSW